MPRDVLAFVDVEEGELGRALIAHPQVDTRHPHRRLRDRRAVPVVAGRPAARWPRPAARTRSSSRRTPTSTSPWRMSCRARSDTPGRSARPHPSSSWSARSGESERFRRQLEDAVRTPHASAGRSRPSTQMGPLIEPAPRQAAGRAHDPRPRRELARRSRGSSTTPGRLWSPGVRDHVAPGSDVPPGHGVLRPGAGHHDRTRPWMRRSDLENAVDYGLTAGHAARSTRRRSSTGLDRVKAGNLYVNRGITGAIVRRQPFGGWKRSSVGPRTKAGGPNYVMSLGRWEPDETAPRENLLLEGISDDVTSVISTRPAGHGVRGLRPGTASCPQRPAGVGDRVRGVARRLGARGRAERAPLPAGGRSRSGSPRGAARPPRAAARRRHPHRRDRHGEHRPAAAHPLVRSFDAFAPLVSVRSVVVEPDARWLSRAAAVRGARPRQARRRRPGGARGGGRWRPGHGHLVGSGDASGRIELLPFLREQAVSITAHRFGNPDRAMRSVRA